jgi:glycosyltransferase involved in cell wall biosynthesis
MLEAFHNGADVVHMKRRSRQGESWIKRNTSSLYYRILSKMSDTPIPRNVGDFRLMSRRVVDEVNRLSERNRYMKGLLSWPGFKQVTIEYDRQARTRGETKWNYWQLVFLAVSGITAFSNKPLRFASWIGAMVAISAFVYGLWVVIRTLIFGDPVTGYPSMMVVILFIGGIQLITIGILGEYIGRIFTEVKGRPNYIIRESRIKQAANRTHSESLKTFRQA